MIDRSTEVGLPARDEGPRAVRNSGDDKAEFADHCSREHQTQLFGYIYSLVRDLDDADDLFQQTSLVLWDKFDQFDRVEELHQLGVRRGAVRGLEFPAGPQPQPPVFQRRAQPGPVEAHERWSRSSSRNGAMRPGGLHEEAAGAGQGACSKPATAGRSAVREVARCRGRSTQSIHNSLGGFAVRCSNAFAAALAQGGVA